MHRLTEFSLKRPWLTLAILLTITVGLGLGVPKVKQAYGFRVMIGEGHPAHPGTRLDMIQEFSGGYPVLGSPGSVEKGSRARTSSMRARSKWPMLSHEELASSSHIDSKCHRPGERITADSERAGFSRRRRFMENGVLASDSQWLIRPSARRPLLGRKYRF